MTLVSTVNNKKFHNWFTFPSLWQNKKLEKSVQIVVSESQSKVQRHIGDVISGNEISGDLISGNIHCRDSGW